MRIILKYPTKSRPDLFLDTFTKYMEASTTGLVAPVITIDYSDILMNNAKMIRWMREMGAEVHVGNSKTKVQAINANIPKDQWDILVLASDDHVPVEKGWDERIVQDMDTLEEPRLLWYRDVRQQQAIGEQRVCFMPVMNRSLYDRFGYIYHPSYRSFWCDNEQTEVCERDGYIRRIDHELFRNESPDWGGTIKRDSLYRTNSKWYRVDQATYERRKQQGFPQ
jgi:hypothetical protein